MPKSPSPDARKKVLLMPLSADGPAPGNGPKRATPGGVPAEQIVVDGRRYRLVPMDEYSDASTVAELLTARELQIVALVAEGRINKQIADILRISEWTVSTHLRRVFAKLGVDTRAAMVSRCLGFVAPRGPTHEIE